MSEVTHIWGHQGGASSDRRATADPLPSISRSLIQQRGISNNKSNHVVVKMLQKPESHQTRPGVREGAEVRDAVMRQEDEMRQTGVDVDAHVCPLRCFDRRVKRVNDAGRSQ